MVYIAMVHKIVNPFLLSIDVRNKMNIEIILDRQTIFNPFWRFRQGNELSLLIKQSIHETFSYNNQVSAK